MSHATPQTRDIARRLIDIESMGNKPSANRPPAAFPVCNKLRPHLASLMGHTGFRTLLLRALMLATQKVPSLAAVQVNADGDLLGLDKLEVQAEAEALAEGHLALVAELLGLLVTFIGEKLSLGLVREVWPKLSLSDLNIASGDDK